MNKHQQVLERFLEQCQELQRAMSLNADRALNYGHVTHAGYFRHEANEAQDCADAIRHALEIMAKADTLPKTADGVTVWPGDNVYYTTPAAPSKVLWAGFDEILDGWHVPFYSTEQAARDAAGKDK